MHSALEMRDPGARRWLVGRLGTGDAVQVHTTKWPAPETSSGASKAVDDRVKPALFRRPLEEQLRDDITHDLAVVSNVEETAVNAARARALASIPVGGQGNPSLSRISVPTVTAGWVLLIGWVMMRVCTSMGTSSVFGVKSPRAFFLKSFQASAIALKISAGSRSSQLVAMLRTRTRDC